MSVEYFARASNTTIFIYGAYAAAADPIQDTSAEECVGTFTTGACGNAQSAAWAMRGEHSAHSNC